MPKGYAHLTYDQRCQIFTLKKRNLSQREIAKLIGSSQSTISRELMRNRGKKGYRYKQANEKAVACRHKASSVKRKMTPGVLCLVEKMLRDDQLSPEQISGRLKRTSLITISHESIYLHIWKDKRSGGDLYKNLRRCGKKYNKRSGKKAGRGLIPNRVGIEERPEEVKLKKRFGDVELDTIVGADHRGAIVSAVDRVTKFVWLYLVPGFKAEDVSKALIRFFEPIKKLLHTATSDNGKEFSEHEEVAKSLDLKFFFANPYHSWERGLNENTNGLVRQYFPKGTDFTKLTQERVFQVAQKLNNRPRKTLDYRKPKEVFLLLTGINPDDALRY
jgi:IS30 family transposase